MSKYLRKFDTVSAYEEVKQNLVLPNVSYVVEINGVHYKPIVPPRMDIITYRATAKLDETTSTGSSSGLHVNSFSGTSGQLTITSHTFENGIGTIEFNGDIASIGSATFYNCNSLTSIIIPSGVTSIGNDAFTNCTSLTSIIIPDSVTSIGAYVFQRCSGLTSVTIGSGVTSIGNGVFSDCRSLTSITVNNGNTVYDSRDNCNAIIKTSTNKLISGCKNTVIPNSVTSIGDYAFNGCTGLTSINIPNSVTSIGNNAFYNCNGLTSCTIGSGVTSITYGAFQYCSSLSSITSYIMSAPSVGRSTFFSVKTNGTLYVPIGSSGYDTWMNNQGNLGSYNWTKVEQ